MRGASGTTGRSVTSCSDMPGFQEPTSSSIFASESSATDFTHRLQADLFKHSPSLTLEPAHEVSFITTALGMVQSGFGVTAQPSRALGLLESFGLISRPLVSPTVDRHLSIFFPRTRSLSPAAESFKDFLLHELAK